MRPSGECACGRRAERLCHDCALAYCAGCCARRHAKGAFRRHAIANNSNNNSNSSSSSSGEGGGDEDAPATTNACDECDAAAAVLRCGACELRFCARCSALVHRSGTMQSHADFSVLADEKASTDAASPSVASVVTWGDAKATPRDAFGLKAEMIRDGEATETPLGCPHPEGDGAAAAAEADADAEAYDLWSGWSVRSFSERSSSIDSTSQVGTNDDDGVMQVGADAYVCVCGAWCSGGACGRSRSTPRRAPRTSATTTCRFRPSPSRSSRSRSRRLRRRRYECSLLLLSSQIFAV